MESVLDKKTEQELEKHLSEFHRLVRQQRTIERRLKATEDAREKVKKAIYDRVRGDYKRELDAIVTELAPVKKEVDSIRVKLEDEIKRIDSSAESVKDQLDELEFRRQVGEFSESQMAEKCAPMQEEGRSLAERKRELQEKIHVIDADPEAEPEPAARAQEAQPEPESSAPEKPEPATETEAKQQPTENNPQHRAKEERRSDPDLVNPGDWMEEFAEDDRRHSNGRRSADQADNGDDPLAKLADPSEEDAAAGQAPAKKDPPNTFPILVITKGPGSGKKVPLVPMTMTIGREHDNNIELKDEEIARYHARITFERGDYLLQDLETSSGTWLNDVQLNGSVTINHGDKIRLGNTELLVDFE